MLDKGILDLNSYPHLAEYIIRGASYEALRDLRSTCKEFKLLADQERIRRAQHIVIRRRPPMDEADSSAETDMTYSWKPTNSPRAYPLSTHPPDFQNVATVDLDGEMTKDLVHFLVDSNWTTEHPNPTLRILHSDHLLAWCDVQCSDRFTGDLSIIVVVDGARLTHAPSGAVRAVLNLKFNLARPYMDRSFTQAHFYVARTAQELVILLPNEPVTRATYPQLFALVRKMAEFITSGGFYRFAQMKVVEMVGVDGLAESMQRLLYQAQAQPHMGEPYAVVLSTWDEYRARVGEDQFRLETEF